MDDMVLDPMILYVGSRLQALMKVIQFESDGNPVSPDGFQLKNLHSWAYETYQSAFESLGALSSLCNLDCTFCYEKGNPVPYHKSVLSLQEAETRLKYFNLDENRGLPQLRQKLYKEPFTNKNLIPILQRVRALNPLIEISLTTNGSLLNEQILDDLSHLKPINLSISLNTVNPEGRRSLMRDTHGEQCLSMIRQMKSHGLCFNGSVVAWPSISIQELIDTIYFLSENSARMIRVTLPGYTRHFSQDHPFETDSTWKEILRHILPLKEKINTPLLVLPSLFHEQALLPEISGIIENSPAGREGLRSKDRIISINGRIIQFRTDAKQALGIAVEEEGRADVEVDRMGARFSVSLKEFDHGTRAHYPYQPDGYPPSSAHPFGIVLIDDFNPKWLWKSLEDMRNSPERTILLMTTPIMEPVISSLLEKYSETREILKEKDLYLWIPEQRFWGGNIILGDLYTCSDFIQAVDDFKLQTGVSPDLLLIPESFSSNHHIDILGVSYSAIEIATGIPVRLMPCSQIIL